LHSRRNPERVRDGRSTKTKDEENFALAGKAKGKKGKGKAESSEKGEKKKDLSKIKCFRCREFGNYATKCPNQNKRFSKNHAAASVEIDWFAS